ncbi:CYtochrome P450 family [Caenorhabditis elegans]|nr:CYtochrome P450 family [Caenorhabditis elegans]SAP35551.1 CYtochrome P450 family [Caenorhabditis elegans]|eukprot:NP_001317794.1 CYtochrome P450 family [Caenorhabditis elegans]
MKKQYGKVFTLWMGPLPMVNICDYDIAYETHVKRANIFVNRYIHGATEYIREGRGIIGSNGDFWLEHRRFALTTFRNFGIGRNIIEGKIMEEYNYRFEDFHETHFKNGAIQVSASMFFDLLVGSIINQLLVSERFEQDDKEFEELKTKLTMALENSSIIEGVMPLWLLKSKFMKWRTKTTFAPFDFIYEVGQKGIQRRVAAIENGTHVLSEEGDDFVDAFIIKIEKDSKEEVESTFTLETLAVDLFDLWVAGQETTSTTLCWAFVCLMNYPEVVEKLRNELTEVTGGMRSVSLADRSSTLYLNATINEIQRIASILNVNLPRVLEEDALIDGVLVPAGTAFATQLSAMHTDDETFKNHKEFNPERFMENNNLEKKLIPFGIGKRSCPGESLARAELYLIIANIVMEYEIEPVGATPKMKTPTPFSLLKRPPSYEIRFVKRS